MARSWPALTTEKLPWTTRVSSDLVSRSVWAEMLHPYVASVVPRIAELDVTLPVSVVAASDDATNELVRFDAEVGHITLPFASVLLRSESAASSHIENLTSGARALGEVELGERGDGNAALIVSNVKVMQAAIDLANNLSESSIIEMQRILLADSSPSRTGGYRAEQVWIGGGEYSPHRAGFVPPGFKRVPGAMADLVAFAARADIPALAHIALTHAHFETIHPFPDGNGRTGRAIVQSMLRSARLTRNVTLPLSAGLLQQKQRYFEALTSYREGDVEPIVTIFTNAVFLAIDNGRTLAADITSAHSEWTEKLAPTRRSSAAHRVSAIAIAHPVLNSRLVESQLGIPPKSALAALARMEDLGILVPATSRARNRIWIAPQILNALDAFAERSMRQR